jgi:hypothetical protein
MHANPNNWLQRRNSGSCGEDHFWKVTFHSLKATNTFSPTHSSSVLFKEGEHAIALLPASHQLMVCGLRLHTQLKKKKTKGT